VPGDASLVAKGRMKLLDAKSGADFDKAFAAGMVSDHKKAVEAFEKEASDGTDADVKAFVSKTLPTLKSHLSMAEDLQNSVGK
jgi:putative membrane protein